MRRRSGPVEQTQVEARPLARERIVDSRATLAGSRKKQRTFDMRDLAGLDPAIRLRIESTVLEVFSEACSHADPVVSKRAEPRASKPSTQELRHLNLVEFAARARTSLQTIYKYYGSKEALVFATLDRELSELANNLSYALAEFGSYKHRLRKMYVCVLDFFERKPSVAALIHVSIHGNTWTHDVPFCQPDLMSIFSGVLAEGRAQGALTDEVEERVLLDILLGVLWRLVHMWLARGMTHSPTQEASASFEVLWRALAKPL